MHLIQKYKVVVLLFLIIACNNGQKIEGNWSVIDSSDNYSELYFDNGQMRIFTEIAGSIGSQKYILKRDSLVTTNLNYKMNWINQDSLVLSSHHSILYLKRINSGFKLSDYTNENLEQKFTDSFYDRMYKRKGINSDSLNHSSLNFSEVEEEIIEIKRK